MPAGAFICYNTNCLWVWLQWIEMTSSEMRGWGAKRGSRKWKCQKKKGWRKWETERSFRPHNVCFLSAAHLRTERDSIVRPSSQGFLSGVSEGQFVAQACWGAPQEDNLSRSILWPQFPAQQNHQLCVRAAHRLVHFLKFMSQSFSQKSSRKPPFLIFKFFVSIYLFFTDLRIYVSLLSLVLSLHLDFIQTWARQPAFPRCRSLGCFLCLRCLGKAAFLSPPCAFHINHMSIFQPRIM